MYSTNFTFKPGVSRTIDGKTPLAAESHSNPQNLAKASSASPVNAKEELVVTAPLLRCVEEPDHHR
jgi:hypothetical protein